MATTVTLKPNAIDISGSTSGTTTLQATAIAGTTTLTLPAATDTLVGKATTDTLTNKTLTGAAMNGTLGATTASTANVTTLTTSSTVTHNGGTANGVAYLNGSKVLTTGSALTFDGSALTVSASVAGASLTSSGAYSYLAFSNSGGVTKAGLILTNSSGILQSRAETLAWTNYDASSEYMRLDSSGNLLLGQTAQINSEKLGVTGSLLVKNTVATGTARLVYQNGAGTLDYFYNYATSTNTGSISTNGTVVLYNTTSDQRLKENIQDADDAASLIDSLQVRKYDWKSDGSHQRYGFVAQELVTVAPEAVHQPINEEDMMAVDYSKLVPMLVKEIQSLRKRLAAANL